MGSVHCLSVMNINENLSKSSGDMEQTRNLVFDNTRLTEGSYVMDARTGTQSD